MADSGAPPPAGLIDTHCHLELLEDTERDLAAAWEDGLEAVWAYVRRMNRLVEEEAPWKLAKDEAQAGRLDAVLRALAAGLRLTALSLYPVVPDTAVEILRRLGQAREPDDLRLERAAWGLALPGEVEPAPPLFPRIETE